MNSELRIKNVTEDGFTLMELLIYTALFVIISVVTISLFIQIVSVTETYRRNRESLDNARRAMDVITQEIKHAKSVYTPTSVLGSHPGQLSLETTRDADAETIKETTTYVDFYLDADHLYLKREGQNSPQIITSEKVKVSNLVFTLLNNSGTGNPTIRTQITVVYADPIHGSTNSVSLVSTTSLRSY